MERREMLIEVIDDATAERLRKMTPAERMALANDMFIQCREMMLAAVRSRNPEWTEAQVTAEVRRRISRGAA
ncbi:MAG: hypothetical protein SFY96_13495 [Planctomycetota bacterium]|nr:hypothetical protein [Planctomycetota bacterium]